MNNGCHIQDITCPNKKNKVYSILIKYWKCPNWTWYVFHIKFFLVSSLKTVIYAHENRHSENQLDYPNEANKSVSFCPVWLISCFFLRKPKAIENVLPTDTYIYTHLVSVDTWSLIIRTTSIIAGWEWRAESQHPAFRLHIEPKTN